MLRKLLFTFGILLFTSSLVFPQSGTLKGKIRDKGTKEPIPFANIVIESGGTQIGGTTTDFDGNFTIKPITPGKYDLKATYVGYKPIMVKGVVINSDKITFEDVELESTTVALETFEVVDYKVPLLSKDKTSTGGTVTSEEIAKMPTRTADAVATTVGGVFSADGERGSVRGQRTEGTVMYIDGMKVRGSSNLPQSSIEEVTVITGGLPAQYGDATGGVINVTTRGPSRIFGAGLELETSQFLDKYGYNRLGFNMQGPLLKRHKDSSNVQAILGYFIAGDFSYNIDGRPSSIDLYKLKDDVYNDLVANPLRPAGLTSGGTYRNADFIRKSDLEVIDHTLNSKSLDFNFSGKFDIKTTQTTNLTLGGSYNYQNYRAYDFESSLMNWNKNAQVIATTYRVFGRFTQRFPDSKENKSVIKNVYYSVQADYTRNNQIAQDAVHKDKLFDYGYVGKFTSHRAKTYQLGNDTVLGFNNVRVQTGYRDTLYWFEPSNLNPEIANYTTYYRDLFVNQVSGHLENPVQYQLGGALLNGQGPSTANSPDIYGLWDSPGTQYDGYGKSDNSQISINLNASADIGNHAIQFGIQYEQRKDNYFGYSPVGFWTLIDPRTGLVNQHISQAGDKSHPEPVYDDLGVFQDTVNYPDLIDLTKQSYFDYNLRKKLGLDPNGSDWIDVDSYDPGIFSVDMFSADELFNQGRSLVAYYGYDYTGKKLTSKPKFSDFFTAKDEFGNYKREIGAFEPIYMAGYIQDKFAFSDLIFNVGLRVDRFDANQMVLKDPYLLYEAKTVKEVTNLGDHPTNMGPDYIVYVDNATSPTAIKGYRIGSKWFTSTGTEIPDPEAYGLGTNNPPYLLNPGDKEIKASAFKDYEPQTNLLPRISFSFPISDEALFFAHYDVLTQRPTGALRFDPTNYLFMESIGNAFISNPNMKSSKTIDYEVGFQQKLSNSSSLNISTFYREMRNQISMYFYAGAYPKPYYSYNNIDFGTVKGLSVTYDLRRTGNARVRASYTLQFADGTGSDNESARSLVLSNEPKLRNLRSTFPVDADRRHALNLVFDYRYEGGPKYNGPRYVKKIKGTKKVKVYDIFENTGASITFNGGSGTPFSRSSRAGFLGGNSILIGSVNGSRLPWQFRMDARIDRDFSLTWGKGKKGKDVFMNVYFEILNVLDAQNILGVYRATGNPDDDGYLASPQAQPDIAIRTDSQSFIDMYRISENSPYSYSQPRRIRLGVSINF
ncbi:MAG: TonB-dependent receptor [Bacteroidetes bacterium]|nr:TonB-dependent receptor [Bacteroidota bacterium]